MSLRTLFSKLNIDEAKLIKVKKINLYSNKSEIIFTQIKSETCVFMSVSQGFSCAVRTDLSHMLCTHVCSEI